MTRRPTGSRDAAEAAFRSMTAKPARLEEAARVPGVRESVTLRIPAAVVEAFQAEGPGWQDRMVEALEKAAPAPSADE